MANASARIPPDLRAGEVCPALQFAITKILNPAYVFRTGSLFSDAAMPNANLERHATEKLWISRRHATANRRARCWTSGSARTDLSGD
jgi:hypothetical protein